MGTRCFNVVLCLTIVGVLVGLENWVFAQTEGPCSPPPYALNRADENYQYLRDPACRTDFWDPIKYMPLTESGSIYLTLSGEARERYEYYSNPNWGSGSPGSGYYLQRYFLGADLELGEHVRLFNQLQASFENWRVGGPRPSIDMDQLDVHQSFLDLKGDLGSDGSFVFRSGRQELAYGSQRLIAVREGPNVRQAFDGFRAMIRTGDVKVDAFATKPVESNLYGFDDGPNNGEALWGLYSVLPAPVLPKGNIDLYYIGYWNRMATYNQGTAPEHRNSVGTRLWGNPKPFDYNYEFVYQFGTFGKGNIQAWTAASDTGYTFASLPLSPRLSLKADITSGDRNPNNPNLQTFNPLFPKGAYFSEDGLIGPMNHIDVNPGVDLHVRNNLTLSLNWDFFWRENVHDGVYNNSLVLVRRAGNSTARYVGSQPQAVLQWDVDRHISFVAIYAHFFAGEFIEQSGPGKDVDYITTWVAYKF